MRESLQAKVVFRAAQVRGGAAALARALGVPLSEVQAWMRSERPIPNHILGELLDAITDDILSRLSSNRQSGEGSR